APLIPLPPYVRGPLLAVAENCVMWPLAAVTDRLHPARNELPTMTGNRRVLAQTMWRHLLFGIVLGELERRRNAEPEPAPGGPEADFPSNGHGSLEHAAAGRT